MGAGTSFDSHFSFSFAQGKVWVVDFAAGLWRGYALPGLGCDPTDQPPVVTCSLQRTLLHPARNGMVPCGLSVTVTDDFDPNPMVEVRVYSDEPNGALPYAPDALYSGGCSPCAPSATGWATAASTWWS